MSAEANLKTVQGIYEAFGRGDVPAILEQLTDDVDWAAEAATDVVPWYGQRRGKDEVVGFFQAIGEALEVLEFTPQSFTANDDGDVMVWIRFRAKVNATGKEIATNDAHYWRFSDGKVAFWRGTEDTAQTVAALQG